MKTYYQKRLTLNKIFKTIKNFEEFFIDEFKKCDIYKCGHCNGTGLENKFDMDAMCSYCGGFGYRGFKKIGDDFVCRNCNGYGCYLCNRRGLVDWITHANGGDILKGK